MARDENNAAHLGRPNSRTNTREVAIKSGGPHPLTKIAADIERGQRAVALNAHPAKTKSLTD